MADLKLVGIHDPITDKSATVNANEHLEVSIEEDNTPALSDTPEPFEDTSFVVGDSPATLDFNAALGRNATDGYLINDGPGDIKVAFSVDGSIFGNQLTIKNNEKISFKKISVDSLQLTWVSDSAYRAGVI